MTDILYAYGIVRDDFALDRAPAGLDDAPLALVRIGGGLAAVVSRLPGDQYAAPAIEQVSGDVGWLTPRAMAHDRVLTWAHDRGPLIPLPMFSLWGSDVALARSLKARERALHRAFGAIDGADEFGLRVHRSDRAIAAAIDALDPALAALRAKSKEAPPGERYLLERKHDAESRKAARAAGQRLAREAFDALAALARDAIARPLVPGADAERVPPDATLGLTAAFLVDRARNAEFRAAVSALMRGGPGSGGGGLLFDFTGPWPPYNFVAGAAGGGAAKSRTAGKREPSVAAKRRGGARGRKPGKKTGAASRRAKRPKRRKR